MRVGSTTPADAPVEGAPLLLDVAAAAGRLSISPWALRQLIAAGELPITELPCPLNQRRAMRRTLIAQADLQEFVERHRMAPTTRNATTDVRRGGIR